MVVEPERLCWLTGRMVKARDGATWAEEFAQFPALEAVVRDDGSGLSKGVKLERARRRVAGLPDLDDALDVFHTLREGGRALRMTWGAAARALGRADMAQRGLDRRGRQGQSRQGHGAALGRLWRQAERIWDQATAAEAAWKQARSALELFTPEGRLNDRAQAEAVIAAALPHLGGRASRSWIRSTDGWPPWGWTPTSCRRCWTWKVCIASLGVCQPPLEPGPWSARPNWQRHVRIGAGRRGESARCFAASGVRAAWWSASTAWRGCNRRGTGR